MDQIEKLEAEGRHSNYGKSESMPTTTEESVCSQPEKGGKLESKKKLKKVRSIRLLRLSSMRSSTRKGKSQDDNLSMLKSVDTESAVSDASSPNYMKATSSSQAKESFQSTQKLFTRRTLSRMSTLKLKRSLTRKLSGRTDQKRKPNSSRSIKLATYAGNQSQRVITRRLSLKPVRILTKMNTFKTKKSSSMEKCLEISQSPDSGLHKPTCSSTLKDSHFPDHIDLPQEGSGSQGVLSTLKVCSYSYCSLHGHHHDKLPPLKRFVSMRRRLLKTQKSMKKYSQPITRSNKSGNTRKANQKVQTFHSEDLVNETPHSAISHFRNMKMLAGDSHVWPHDTPGSTLTGVGTSGGEDEEKNNFRYNAEAEVLLGETSFPHVSFEEYLNSSLAVKGYPLSSFLAINETNMECCCIATENEESDSKVTETAGSDNSIAAWKENDDGATVESTSTNIVKSSASDIEILEGGITTESRIMEPNYEELQVNSAQDESKPANTTDVAYRTQERDHKYIKMWHLMYKHAVLSNTGKGENKLPFDGKDKEGRGQEQDALSFDEVNSSSSCQDHSETDQDMDDENKNVIEMVQKAFDEILLPETEDISSDDHFKSRGIGSDEVLLEKGEGQRGERTFSTSREPPKEETWLKVDNLRSHQEDITAQRMVTKPDQKTPKSWSNLKKLILLKRFVKALEKARNFNPRRPRHLPSDATLEAEKVFLKHQTAEERKNAEDWMLDHALQKVISKLAPAQKRRVALLVEAFETILPFQDAENGPQSSATVETQANPIQSLDDSLDHNKDETNKGRDYGYSAKILLGKALTSYNSVVESADNASENPMAKMQNPWTEAIKNIPASGATDEDKNGKQSLASSDDSEVKSATDTGNIYLAEIKDSRSQSLSNPVEIVNSCHEEVSTNEIANEVPENLMSNSNQETPNSKSESPARDFETKNLVGANREQFAMSKNLILKGLVRSLGSNLVGSGAPSDQLDEPTADRKERIEKGKLETETLEGFPTHKQSEAPKSAVIEPDTQLGKQNSTGLWYLVYKHMISGISENESKPAIEGADEKESGNDGSRTRGTSFSKESTPVMNQDMYFKDQGTADPEVELQQIEAIKMVEEAIDSILPDDKDHLPDGQSLTDNTISGNSSKQSNRTERVHSEDLNHKEERMASGNRITGEQEGEEPAAPKEGNKPNQQLPRSWSNLKKVIMLKRFIKALEKVRKFNPRGPRYLPIEPDSEAEKVLLRHQDMAERKGTEEWMLDYALQQVVSKLTPARKRKVGLLVEAFETVIPTIQPAK